jgi:integrase
MGFPFGPFVQTLVLTAQRRDEVAGMGRRELKDAGALWTIPAPRTKKGLEHDVPLSAAAKEVLTEIPRIGRSDLVFTTAGVTSMSGYSKAKARMDALMMTVAQEAAVQRDEDPGDVTLEAWRLHDLRRTAASGNGPARHPRARDRGGTEPSQRAG